MLVNLTPNVNEVERRRSISKEHNFVFIPQYDPLLMQYGIGIYQCRFDHNFLHREFLEFDNMTNIPFDQSYESFKPEYNKVQFGVADSVEQIKQYYKEEIDDLNRKYFITITPVYQDKKNAGNGGGWRWHKWGKYIGELNPQCEYLDDEDFGDSFEYVICFHLYEIK